MKIFNINYNMTSRVGNVQSNGNILSKGDSGVNKIVVSFDEPQTDACYMVVKRYDGATTNNLYMTPDFANQNYYIVFQEWMTGVAGDLEITVKLVGDTEQTFGKVYLEVYDSLTESEETITDAQYQGLLQSLNDHIGNTNNPHITNANNAEYESGVSIKQKIDSDKQELDDHVSDKENPHEVTAEQVDTYNKATIDEKDDDTLQEAKDYTYSQAEIDNKDANTLQTAKDYTYSKVEIDNKDTDKLDKIWTDLTNQTTSFLTDEFVLNRGNSVYKTTLATMLSNVVPTEIFVVVQELPETGQINKIYLVINQDSEAQNIYDEFIWVFNEDTEEYGWERIGSVGIDLSNYYTKSEITALLLGKVDKVVGKGLSTNDFTNNDKNKLDGIEAGAEVNTVDSVNGQTGVVVLDAEDVGALPGDTPLFSGDYDDLSNKPTIDQLLGNLSTLGFVKRTGTNAYVIDTSSYQPLDADLSSIAGLSGTSGLLKKTASNTWQLDTSVYLTEITKLMVEAVLTGTITTHTHNASDIAEDASHRFVTDAEKNTWNAKQNALGFTPENAANKKTTLSDSDVEYPTSKAVKTAIETAVSQTLKPMGNWNANTNTPTLTNNNTSRANEMYYVSVAGTQFGIEFDAGDELVYNTNGVIFKRDNVDSVVSVNTKKGVVVLNQDDIGDGATYKQVSQTEKNTWNNKVDKVAGKGLSDENFTLLEKNKLASLTQVVPDEETIVLNDNDEFEATNVSIWRYE